MKSNNKGFTLIELVLIIANLGILAAIAIPRLSGFIDNANREVCNSNCRNIERAYQSRLMEEGIDYLDSHFTEFLEETDQLIGPNHSIIDKELLHLHRRPRHGCCTLRYHLYSLFDHSWGL